MIEEIKDYSIIRYQGKYDLVDIRTGKNLGRFVEIESLAKYINEKKIKEKVVISQSMNSEKEKLEKLLM